MMQSSKILTYSERCAAISDALRTSTAMWLLIAVMVTLVSKTDTHLTWGILQCFCAVIFAIPIGMVFCHVTIRTTQAFTGFDNIKMAQINGFWAWFSFFFAIVFSVIQVIALVTLLYQHEPLYPNKISQQASIIVIVPVHS